MLYRFRGDFCVPPKHKKLIEDLYYHAEAVMGEAVADFVEQDPIEHTGEESFIEIHKCYHGEEKNKPCKVVERIEV